MHNLPKHFVDVPIVSVQSDLSEDKTWVMEARTYESDHAFACSYVIKDILQEFEAKLEKNRLAKLDSFNQERITFLFHYCMNFRSKYGRELKAKLRRGRITDSEHELGTKALSNVSFALKETKSIMDRLKVQIKP